MLNSIIYEVKFEERHVKEYSANTITDNMLTKVDSYGFNHTMISGSIDYRKDAATAVTKSTCTSSPSVVKIIFGRPHWDGNSWFNGGTSVSHGSI